LVYDASVRLSIATSLVSAGLIVAGGHFALSAQAAEDTSVDKPTHPDNPKSEPKYDETFSGPIVEVSATKITVSRSILGKPAEKRSFLIKPDTRIDGKLRVHARVTVGYVTTDDGDDIARLIVVRSQKQADKK